MTTFSPTRFAVLSLITVVATAQLGAQGLSYDTRTTADGMPARGGGSGTTTVMQTGRGQFSNGNVRIDFGESSIPSGFESAGHYMVMKKGTTTTVYVDPAKRQYAEVDMAELAKAGTDIQKSLGGMVKTEMTGVTANVENLGPSETMEGYATVKYRITYGYTSTTTVMGHTTTSTEKSVSEAWIATALDGAMTPNARAPAAAGAAMSELTDKLAKAWGEIPKGVVLKSVTRSESTTKGKTRDFTITRVVSNIKRGPISPSVFEVPAGYTKTDMMSAMPGRGPAR